MQFSIIAQNQHKESHNWRYETACLKSFIATKSVVGCISILRKIGCITF